MIRKTAGWRYDADKDKQVQEYMIIGYAATRAEALQMLADFNQNPCDLKAAKTTFQTVYDRWSKEKYPFISTSNVHG